MLPSRVAGTGGDLPIKQSGAKGNDVKSQHQQRVEEFMARAGQAVPDKPTLPDAETCLGRARLHLEETLETIEALGFYVYRDNLAKHGFNVGRNWFVQPDLTAIIHECCDLQFVATGTLSACGVPDRPFIREVDQANLRKFSGDAHRDANGKWIKPTGFVGPDIAGVLKQLEDA